MSTPALGADANWCQAIADNLPAAIAELEQEASVLAAKRDAKLALAATYTDILAIAMTRARPTQMGEANGSGR